MAIFGDDADDAFFLVDVFDGAQRAVHPTFVFVVFDEDDLRAWFQLQLHRCGK